MNHPSPTYAIGCLFDFDVEQPHIDEGVQRNCEDCPVALALHSARPEAKRIETGLHGVSLWFTDGHNEYWSFDGRTMSRIFHYDVAGRMRPFRARMTLHGIKRPQVAA